LAEIEWELGDDATPAPVVVTPPSDEYPRAFRRIFKKLLPTWLSSDEGELVNYSIGLLLDAFAERARQGVLARFPSYAPPDAYPYLGRDRKIVRGIDEAAESFVPRLLVWLDEHLVRGNPLALCRTIRAYCNAPVRVRTVDANGNWFCVDRDGTESYLLDQQNWNWDGVPASPHFSRFWVIIYPADGVPWAAVEGTIGDAHPGQIGRPGETIGTTATPEQVTAIRAIIREWQTDGTRCEWVIVAFDDASFDPAAPEPDGTWGRWGKYVAGNYVPARLTTARYWSGS
jgi:hypothetical protein